MFQKILVTVQQDATYLVYYISVGSWAHAVATRWGVKPLGEK